MQREIKFRGINKINNSFVYGYYYVEKGIHYIHSGHTLYVVDKNTVGQYVSLSDKQVLDIFEGDIVTMSAGLFKNIPMEVKWCDINLCFVLTFKGLSKSKEMKVTKQKNLLVRGNIHQHKHLLE